MNKRIRRKKEKQREAEVLKIFRRKNPWFLPRGIKLIMVDRNRLKDRKISQEFEVE